MKRLSKISILIFGVIALIATTMGCSYQTKKTIHIAALNGPTGMGIVKLMEEEKENYEISLYQNPDEIVGKVVNGEVDVACIPSNMGAVLYNKTKGNVKLLGINTLGVLYIVENGQTINKLEDLKGKTILASGKGSTPEFILNHVLSTVGIDYEKDVTIKYLANHADIASQLAANEGTIALLPQPFVTTVLAKNDKVRMAIDINEVWANSENVDLPMGVIIGQKEFVENRKADLKVFLEDYKKSVSFIEEDLDAAAELVAKYKIVPSAEVAKKAIPKCNIVFRDSQESKETLNKFYEIISKDEPKSVGGKIPDEAFYIKE